MFFIKLATSKFFYLCMIHYYFIQNIVIQKKHNSRAKISIMKEINQLLPTKTHQTTITCKTCQVIPLRSLQKVLGEYHLNNILNCHISHANFVSLTHFNHCKTCQLAFSQPFSHQTYSACKI